MFFIVTRKFARTVLMFLTGVIFLQPTLAQNELKALFDSLFQTKNALISGMENNLRYPPGEGHPFFGEQSWRRGFVKVQRHELTHEAVRYDLLNDQLLVQHFSASGSHVIKMIKQNVTEFQLDGHRFYYLEGQKGKGSEPEPGYYELAYGTGPEIWIRWKKILSEGSRGNSMYEQDLDLFIKSKNHFYSIRNRKSLLGAFPDCESEIRTYLKKENIAVRRMDPEELTSVVRYYTEQLN